MQAGRFVSDVQAPLPRQGERLGEGVMHVVAPHLASPPSGGEEYERPRREFTELTDKPQSYLFCASKRFSSSLPRFTASSRAALASFLPDHTCSSSSSTTSRICTKLPMRRPLELGVGGMSVSSLTATSRPGNFL